VRPELGCVWLRRCLMFVMAENFITWGAYRILPPIWPHTPPRPLRKSKSAFRPRSNAEAISRRLLTAYRARLEAMEIGTGGYHGTGIVHLLTCWRMSGTARAWKTKFEDSWHSRGDVEFHGNPVQPDRKACGTHREAFGRQSAAERLMCSVLWDFPVCREARSLTLSNWIT